MISAPESAPAIGAPESVPAELAELLPRLAATRLSKRIPALYPAAVRYHRARRRLEWTRDMVLGRVQFADSFAPADTRNEQFGVRIKKHNSLLLRTLGPDEMVLQHNKVHNLRLAAAKVDGIVIKPGQTFSFNQVVGNCTRRQGYKEGMRLSNGMATPGVGGGICQLANLLHWMMLHSPLTVTERSTHSFDPFPDNGRVLPWGVGCSIVYNYVDLQCRNDTDQTFVFSVNVGDRYLEGELLANDAPESSYKVRAEHERFFSYQGQTFRHNEIWRDVINRRTGDTTASELVRRNTALVTYIPKDAVVTAVTDSDVSHSAAGAAAERQAS